MVKRGHFEVLRKKSSTMTGVVWAEESQIGLRFEIRPSYDDAPMTSPCQADGQSSCSDMVKFRDALFCCQDKKTLHLRCADLLNAYYLNAKPVMDSRCEKCGSLGSKWRPRHHIYQQLGPYHVQKLRFGSNADGFANDLLRFFPSRPRRECSAEQAQAYTRR